MGETIYQTQPKTGSLGAGFIADTNAKGIRGDHLLFRWFIMDLAGIAWDWKGKHEASFCFIRWCFWRWNSVVQPPWQQDNLKTACPYLTPSNPSSLPATAHQHPFSRELFMTGQLHRPLSACTEEDIQLLYRAGGMWGKGWNWKRESLKPQKNLWCRATAHVTTTEKKGGGEIVPKKPSLLTDKGKPAQNYFQARGKKFSAFIHLHGGLETFRCC